jgi:hypothetical protein
MGRKDGQLRLIFGGQDKKITKSMIKPKMDIFLREFRENYSNNITVNGGQVIIDIENDQIDYIDDIYDTIQEYLVEFTDIGYYTNCKKGCLLSESVYMDNEEDITALAITVRTYKDEEDNDDYDDFDSMKALKKNQQFFKHDIYEQVNKFINKIKELGLKVKFQLWNGIDMSFTIVHEKDGQFVEFEGN